MKIVILGPGAIGALWAVHLKLSQHDVSVWGRSFEKSITLQVDTHPNLIFENANPDTLRKADLVIITVKAWQVDSALKPLRPYLAKHCILLFMHNGMGAINAIENTLSSHPILLATTTHAALKQTSNQILHTGHGITYVGAYNAQGRQHEYLANLLDLALPEVKWHSDINVALWHKLAINCVINPLTAIKQCCNGELAHQQHAHLLEALLSEIVAVMNAEGVITTLDEQWQKLMHVIHATKNNYSSMHQDIFFKRKTEIDFINGYLLHVAHQHQITVPENNKLYLAIKKIECSWTTS